MAHGTLNDCTTLMNRPFLGSQSQFLGQTLHITQGRQTAKQTITTMRTRPVSTVVPLLLSLYMLTVCGCVLVDVAKRRVRHPVRKDATTIRAITRLFTLNHSSGWCVHSLNHSPNYSGSLTHYLHPLTHSHLYVLCNARGKPHCSKTKKEMLGLLSVQVSM